MDAPEVTRATMIDDAATSGRLAELYDQHAAGAVRLAYLLTGDRDVAEDLVQEAFVRLVGRFHYLRSPAAFGPYLRTTIVNLTRGHFRKRRSERTFMRREGTGARDRAAGLPNIEERDRLWIALQGLASRQRAVVVLRYYEDLSEQQTADVLGCSVRAIKSLNARALAALRAQDLGGEE